VQLLTGWLLYLFILVTTFAIVAVLPVALVAQGVWCVRQHRLNRGLIVAILIAAAFVTGGLAGWSLRPAEWKMGLAESFYAGGHADIYGHDVESKAERAAIYFFLLPGDALAVAVGVAALLLKSRRRAITP